MTGTRASTTLGSMAEARAGRVQAIADAGGLEEALVAGALPKAIDTTLAEALVPGLLPQGERISFARFRGTA